jgi:hypothetical protein
MEEKERYTLENFELDEPIYIFDNKTQNIVFTLIGYNYDELCSLMCLLNQQDTRIKELEKENQQLKEKLEYYKGSKLGDFADEIRELKHAQNKKAIEELEQLREKFGYKHNSQLMISSKYLCDFIDNQIKKLRGKDVQ